MISSTFLLMVWYGMVHTATLTPLSSVSLSWLARLNVSFLPCLLHQSEHAANGPPQPTSTSFGFGSLHWTAGLRRSGLDKKQQQVRSCPTGPLNPFPFTRPPIPSASAALLINAAQPVVLVPRPQLPPRVRQRLPSAPVQRPATRHPHHLSFSFVFVKTLFFVHATYASSFRISY